MWVFGSGPFWVAAAAVVSACWAVGLVGAPTGSARTVPGDRDDTAAAGRGLHAPGEAAAAGRPPVVMIVFDAFPTVSLLNARGRIDRVRYPAFARLAADSTWFPYATTSVDETGRAFREIFTGRTSWRFAKPTYAKHPKNLFTLLGRRYHIEAGEEATSFCPKRLCPNVRPQTGESIHAPAGSGPAGALHGLARALQRRRDARRSTSSTCCCRIRPGSTCRRGTPTTTGRAKTACPGSDWHSIPWLIQQKYQRHLLQLEFTDRLLGRALDELHATGLYDRSLIVVTADHGESFGRPGNGRDVDRRNVGDIALKPLFVKLPFQHAGRIDRRHVRNIDILPTIARVARLRPGWRVEGRSVFGPAARRIPRSSRDDQARRRAHPAEPEIAAPPRRGFPAAEAEAVRHAPAVRSGSDRTANCMGPPPRAGRRCRRAPSALSSTIPTVSATSGSTRRHRP